jgi:hypothetical protein
LSGPLAFPVVSAVADFSNVTLALTSLSRVDLCAVNQQQPVNTEAVTISFFETFTAGKTYGLSLFSQPDGGSLSRVGLSADAGFPLFAMSTSGTVTLTKVTKPGALADGGTMGGEVVGNFSATLLDVTDGGSSSLTGSFDATGCP